MVTSHENQQLVTYDTHCIGTNLKYTGSVLCRLFVFFLVNPLDFLQSTDSLKQWKPHEMHNWLTNLHCWIVKPSWILHLSKDWPYAWRVLAPSISLYIRPSLICQACFGDKSCVIVQALLQLCCVRVSLKLTVDSQSRMNDRVYTRSSSVINRF